MQYRSRVGSMWFVPQAYNQFVIVVAFIQNDNSKRIHNNSLSAFSSCTYSPSKSQY